MCLNFKGYTYFFVALTVLCVLINPGEVNAQQISPTPVRAVLSTSTPRPTQLVLATSTPTPTATQPGATLLEVRTDAGTANVRVLPDIESQIIGALSPGDPKVVTGQYFRWIQIQYNESQQGWIFEDLITITNGVREDIPVYDPYAEPTSTGGSASVTDLELITQTPGAIMSLTADTRVIIPPSPIQDSGLVEEVGTRLPTFTPPPNFTPGQPIVRLSPAPVEVNLLGDVSEIPPILPIILLGAMGVLGILISVVRR